MPKNNAANVGFEAVAPARRAWRRILQSLLVLLVLVDALFFVLALKPAEERAREQRESQERLRADLRVRRDSISRLRAISANIGAAQRQDSGFYEARFLPKASGFSIIMEEVDKLAQASRVRKGAVSYALAEVRGRPELSQVEITTGLEGDYANIVQFINSVERSQLFLIIDNITVVGGTPLPGQPRLVRLSLRLITFFRV